MLHLVVVLALSGAGFTYDAQGRRDPFVSQAPSAVKAPPTEDVRLTGLVRTPAGRVALLEGPGGRTHVLGVGGRISGARVEAIDPDGVTLRRDDGTRLRLEAAR
jgi:Tfp pilus assembly protein PilP